MRSDSGLTSSMNRGARPFAAEPPIMEPACGIRRSVRVPMKSEAASFYTFDGLCDGQEHFALGFGAWQSQKTPLVRLHSECITGDLFGSQRCDCGDQLQEAIDRMIQEGGVLLYLRQEGRGIGIYNKLDAYALQDQGFDTFEANQLLDFPADGRSYRAAAQMLKAMGIGGVRLLSNNPDKHAQLAAYGVDVAEMISTGTYAKKANERYLRAKIDKTAHRLQLSREV